MKKWTKDEITLALLDGAAIERRIAEIVARIKPILAHEHPSAQGAALAELTALWLAGHASSNSDATRETLLRLHVEEIKRLVPQRAAQVQAAYRRKPS